MNRLDNFYNFASKKLNEIYSDSDYEDDSTDYSGYVEITKILLNQPGIDINAKDKYGNTILLVATSYGCDDVIKTIIKDPEIEVNALNGDGLSSLMLISETTEPNMDIVKMLLSHPKIDVTITNNDVTFLDNIMDCDESIYNQLKDYAFQKQLIANKRDDILLMLDKENLIDPKIKQKYPKFFSARSWGLIN